jgi:hypothetical protein
VRERRNVCFFFIIPGTLQINVSDHKLATKISEKHGKEKYNTTFGRRGR